MGKIKIKQIKSPTQPSPKIEQTVDSDQSEKVGPNEEINVPDSTTGENNSTSKRKIFKRVWTFFLQHPIAVITCIGIFFGGLGTLFMGIKAIRSNNSNLSLSGEDMFRFIQVVRSDETLSDETLQIEKSLQEVKGNPKASVLDRAIAEVFKLQTDGKIDKAIERWQSIANIAEGNDNKLAAGAWFSAGDLLLERGGHEKAISDFSKALDLKPDYVEAYYGRGAAKLKIGKFKEAIDDFGKVLEIDPDYVKAYYSRGFARLSLSKYKDANIDFKKALELKPNYIEAKKGLEETEVYLESIKPLNPNTANAEAYYSRGFARLKVSEFKKAIADFSKVLDLKPDYVEAYYGRGAAKFSIGQYQFAVADYNKFILLNPGSPSAYANRGEAKINLKQYKSAIVDCDKAIQLDSNYAYAYYIRADAKYALRDIEGGKLDLETALKLAEEVGDEKLKDQIELRIGLTQNPFLWKAF